MNQPQPVRADLDAGQLSAAGSMGRGNSKTPKQSQIEDEDKEAFDHERFPGGFYQGIVTFLDQVRGRGVVRSYSGRELRFEFPFVSVVGAGLGGRCPGIDLLHQGDRIGFDVGWTSKGLRITMIKPVGQDNRG